MAWVDKYQCGFYDLGGIQWVAKFYKEDWSGGVTTLTGGGSPMEFSVANGSDDVFFPIKVTSVKFSIVVSTNFALQDICSGETMSTYVELFKDESSSDATPYWVGYVDHKQYSEPYENPPYEVEISCIDGLDLLSNIRYADQDSAGDIEYYNGRLYESQIILDILGKIGYVEFKEFVNLYEENMFWEVSDSPFDQIRIDVDIFNEMTCLSVLQELLKKYNACIVQKDGVFCIYRPKELIDATVYGRHFTGANTKTAVTLSPIQYINRTSTHASTLRQIPGGVRMQQLPAKKVSLNQDYGYKESWIENYELKLETYDSDTNLFENWSSAGGIFNIGYFAIDEKDGLAIPANATQYFVNAYQDFGDYLIATSDLCMISFEYYLYNYVGNDLSDVTISMKIKAKNANKWLGFAADNTTAVWSNTEVYVDVTEVTCISGQEGWISVSRTIPTGLPVDGPYTVTLYNPYKEFELDFLVAFKNVKFYSTASNTYNKRTKRTFWQRLEGQIGYGESFMIKNKYTRQRITEPADDKLTVEYTHTKFNAVEGDDIEYDIIIGDVPSTSSPASKADTDLDNVIEQFAGGMIISILYTKAQAAENFDTAHSADYPGITVTHSGDTVIFTEADGIDFTGDTTIVNASGNLTGSVAPTQGHVTGLAAIATIPITGTTNGSTAQISCNGESEVMTFNTSVSQTIDDFLALYTETFANAGATPSKYDTTNLRFTTASGVDFVNFPTWATLTGDIATTGVVDTQNPVVAVARIDTVTLSGTNGTANITCDGVTELAVLTGTYSSTKSWWKRQDEYEGSLESSGNLNSLAKILLNEIAEQYSRTKDFIQMPILETGGSPSTLNILGSFMDDLNVNDSQTPIRSISGWTLSDCTLVLLNSHIRYTSTNVSHYIQHTCTVIGKLNRYINIKYKYISGSTDPQTILIYYSTAGHSYEIGYSAYTALNFDGDWHVATIDMENLFAGGTDWHDSTITGIRIHISGYTAMIFDIDWIGFPRSFVVNRGGFDIRDCKWELDLVEIIR